MSRALDHVVDALDIETFIRCGSEEEARQIAEGIIREMNLAHGDIVFLEWKGPGARLRLRTYMHRPGDRYQWMNNSEAQS